MSFDEFDDDLPDDYDDIDEWWDSLDEEERIDYESFIEHWIDR